VGIIKQKHRLVLILILTVLLIKAYYSEKVPVNDGLGWDGFGYANLIRNAETFLGDRSIDKYLFQRIGIPLVLHHVFRLFNIGFLNSNFITAFEILNLVCILVSVVYFFKISKKLQLTSSTEIIGFTALFFCFPIIKLCGFYPILLDIPAFTIGIMLVYHYLQNNITLYFLLIFIGSFIFPTFLIMSLLFLFKKETIGRQATESPAASLDTKWTSGSENIIYPAFYFFFPLLTLIMFYFLYYKGSWGLIAGNIKTETMSTLLVWYSLIIALGYILYLTYFRKPYFNIKNILSSVNPLGIIIAFLVYMNIQLLSGYYTSDAVSPLTLKMYLTNVIGQAVQNPAAFLVAHIFYYGLTFALILFLIRDLKKEIMTYGFGMIAFFTAVIFFSVGSESRQLINYYPFLVVLMLGALNKQWNISLSFSIIYSGICLGLSHFWYTIDIPKDASAYESFNPFLFPMQRYFMFQGPWVNDKMYVIHLSVCLLLCLFLFISFKNKKLISRK
jgi:hypothetical protein